MNILKRSLRVIGALRFKYLFSGSLVFGYGRLSIGKNVKIRNSKIIVTEGSSLFISDNNSFDSVLLALTGDIKIGQDNIFEQKGSNVKLEIVGVGNLQIGDKNRIRSKIWIRFGGLVSIGSYTNINEGSEIRCDIEVAIGSYNQISYDVMIWDTNTHNIYPANKRRQITENYYPIFGMEIERPSCKPISIGNDCWIAKDVTLLKGTVLNNKCIVGYRALLSNTIVEENTTVYSAISLQKIKNQI